MSMKAAMTSVGVTVRSEQTCYFSICPPSSTIPSGHYLLDTPLTPPDFDTMFTSDPSNPLLAVRSPPPSVERPPPRPRMNTSSFLQLQTRAAHTNKVRPQPRPIQDVFHIGEEAEINSDDSIDSVASTDSAIEQPPPSPSRCSRCHRNSSVGPTNAGSDMVQYGLNLFYCTRCANIVGFGKR